MEAVDELGEGEGGEEGSGVDRDEERVEVESRAAEESESTMKAVAGAPLEQENHDRQGKRAKQAADASTDTAMMINSEDSSTEPTASTESTESTESTDLTDAVKVRVPIEPPRGSAHDEAFSGRITVMPTSGGSATSGGGSGGGGGGGRRQRPGQSYSGQSHLVPWPHSPLNPRDSRAVGRWGESFVYQLLLQQVRSGPSPTSPKGHHCTSLLGGAGTNPTFSFSY